MLFTMKLTNLGCLNISDPKLIFRLFFIQTGLAVITLPYSASAQPFLNSLAVLFRARPPWPTNFPIGPPPGSSRNSPKSLHSSTSFMTSKKQAPAQQGILVAHPIPNVSTNKFQQFPSQFHHSPKHPSHSQSFFQHSIGTTRTPQTVQNLPKKSEAHFSPIPAVSNTQSSQSGKFRFPDSPSPPLLQSLSGSGLVQTNHELLAQASAQSHFHKAQWQPPERFESSGTSVNPVQVGHSPNVQLEKPQFPPHKAKLLDFKPSPMLVESGAQAYESSYTGAGTGSSAETKSISSFQATDAKEPPRYESGFKPISYHQYASNYGTTSSHETYKNSYTQWNPTPWMTEPSTIPMTTTTMRPIREERKIITATASKSVVSTDASIEDSRSLERDHISIGRDKYPTHFASTPSSSERIEDWIEPNRNPPIETLDINSQVAGFRTDGKQILTNSNSGSKLNKFPVYTKTKDKHIRVRPTKCEKFHRYGFCPVTHHYPLSQVERIAARCSALLSHLIAPLPRTDVHYDIVVTRNESRRSKTPGVVPRQRQSTNKGWSWKNYRGKPVCDTEEVKITPGWAKNEEGEWLVILQTEIWKQEAQISVCSFAHDADSCHGMECFKKQINSLGTKCVQRFTAQRLAVLDPENQERCPIIRSVFLPSACVCLSDNRGTGSSSEESSTGSVVPIRSSEESSETVKSLEPRGRRRKFITMHAPKDPSGHIFIQNGTFTTTVVVTENSNRNESNSTPSYTS